MTKHLREVVGLVPAAGRAKRLMPLPCSKEVYPVGFTQLQSGEPRARVASDHLFEKFSRAGATRAYVILRDGKWDIPAYFRDGQTVGTALAYLVIEGSLGPPDTLDRAYPFVTSASIVFGFPDILFGPDDVFDRLLVRLHESNADVVLGLHVAHDVTQADMIGIDGEGRVQSFLLKPTFTDLGTTWVSAVWAPTFTEFMHLFMIQEKRRLHEGGETTPAKNRYGRIDAQGDLPLGAVIKAAVEQGLKVYGLPFLERPTSTSERRTTCSKPGAPLFWVLSESASHGRLDIPPVGQARRRCRTEILARTIHHLARELDTPVFEPHVTLLANLGSGDERAHAQRSRALAARLQPWSVVLTEPSSRDEHFRCLFMQVEPTDAVMRSHAVAAALFDRVDEEPYLPHLSLVYGSFPKARKRQIIGRLPSAVRTSFTVNTIYLLEAKSTAPKDWREMAGFKVAAPSGRSSRPR